MWNKELEAAIKAGLAAKEKIMEIYNHGFEVEIKSDHSPVTLADKTADKMIREALAKEFPEYGFLTEESEDNLERRKKDCIWIVDPVDGTKDFVAKNGEFTTNIALAYKGEAVLGVVVLPAFDTYYYAVKGQGAYKVTKNGKPERIHVNDKTDDLTVLCSNFHLSDLDKAVIKKHEDRIKHVKQFGSSIKTCKIAEGSAELSYRMTNGTKEWDTAAMQVVIEEAGGCLLKLDTLEPIRYNREDVYNREGYIVVNRKENILL